MREERTHDASRNGAKDHQSTRENSQQDQKGFLSLTEGEARLSPLGHARLLDSLAQTSPLSAASIATGLQKSHGNRYLQRVVRLAAKENGAGDSMAGIERSIQNARGSGEGLDSSVRRSMEKAFGTDFGAVRIHTGSESDHLNRALNARAFTTGQDIFFRDGEYSPRSSAGQQLLAHELTHVVQQGDGVRRKIDVSEPGDESEREADLVSRRVMKSLSAPQVSESLGRQAHPLSIMRQGLLTPAEEVRAVSFTTSNYNSRSVRIIQNTTGATVNGVFSGRTAEAVATYQDTHGGTVDGMVGEETLNAMVPELAAVPLHEHAIQLVVDFYNLDVRSDTLTVHYDATLATAGASSFEPGNLRVIRVGPAAFADAVTLRDAIRNELATPAPAAAVPGVRPDFLTPGRENTAVAFNRSRYQDRRSVRAIQDFVGGAPTGTFTADTAERVAEFQDTNGLQVDGQVGRETLREMVTQIDAAGQQNAAIRLIIDYFNLSEQGALLDISYDPTVAANATTSGVIPGPSVVRVGPNGFAQGFEGLVHTIAHELEHVRQRRVGITNRHIREFLGEAIEIMSSGMPEEDLAGFMDDAGRCLEHWNQLTPAEMRSYWTRFTQVRRRIRQRFNAASVADQALHQALMDDFNAVVYPPP